MRTSLLCFSGLVLLPLASAFPWMTERGMEALLSHPEARDEMAKRGLIDGVGSLVGGTLGSITDSVLGLLPDDDKVNGLKRFPEADHPFKEPGPTDQRGPCPGLNTLANHGYIPRTGIATVGDIISGTQKLFNMGADLAALLSVGGALDGGDILTQQMSIGGADDRVGLLGGALNGIFGTPSGITGHGKFNEGDASATRLDFYLNDGDNYSFQPDLFKQMHQVALEHGGTYNVDTIKEHFKNRYAASKAANKQFYFNVPSAAVVMGAYYFIPGFFSNGSYLDGGVPNEGSITSFYGAKPDPDTTWDDPNRSYTHVAERIPEEGWYRRKTPMTVAEAVGGILDVYLYAKPAIGGSGADGSFVLGPVNIPTDVPGFSCLLYNAIYANFPSELFNTVSLVQAIINPVSSYLLGGLKALGCPVDFPDRSPTLSKAQYENESQQFVGLAKTKCPGSGWYDSNA